MLLSNLPEAAGGAKEMVDDGHSNSRVFGLWAATAIILGAAALGGNFFLRDASEQALSLIKAFAGGAVFASLAVEVFPEAYREDRYWAGIATAIGFGLTLFLDGLG